MAKQKEIATELAPMANAAFDPETGEVFDSEPVPTFNTETEEMYDDGLAAPPVVYTGNAFAMLTAQLDALENARPVVKLNSTYFQFTQAGQSLRGIFQGFSTITKNAPEGVKEIRVVQILTREHGMTLHGGVSIFQHFENMAVGTPIELCYDGTQKTKSGHNVKTFSVSLLGL